MGRGLMGEHVFEEEITRRYATHGFGVPEYRWVDNPEQFDRAVGEARIAAILDRDIDVATIGATRCLCPACLGLDVTSTITLFAPSWPDPRRVALINAVDDIGGGVRSLAIEGHLYVRGTMAGMLSPIDGERLRPSERGPSWATAWDAIGGDSQFLTDAADAWLCTPFACVVLRPGRWSFDADGHLHDEAGRPAIEWSDGWAVSFDHGVYIPAWASDASNLTVERINEIDNVEQRRVLAQRLGYDWFLANDQHSRLIDDDADRGQLWDLGRDRSRSQPRLLRVLDATPTPGGDRKVYWLNVPPHVATAQEAVAWTFGLGAGDYGPEVET